MGGKDSAYMFNIERFCISLSKIFDPARFYTSGLLHLYDIRAANFNAVGSFFLLEQNLAEHVQIWNFNDSQFRPFTELNPRNDEQHDVRLR